MNNVNDCRGRRESIVAMVLGVLDERAAGQLREHIQGCSICQGVRDALADEEHRVRSAFESLARGAKAAETAVYEGGNRPRQRWASAAWLMQLMKGTRAMIFAHKRMSAAVVVLVVVAGALVFNMLPSSSSVAYALDQTTRANREVRYYHVKVTPALGGIGEGWAELDAKGDVIHLRMDFPEVAGDGAKVSILSPDKAEVWFKGKNSFVIVNDKSAMKRFAEMRVMFDPKLAFQQLQRLKQSGEVQVETKEPVKKGDPVTVTVTFGKNPNRKDAYLVNSDTKLVEQYIKYLRKDQTWEIVARYEYLDYNKPIDPKIWQPDMPKDVMRVDQTTGKIGVAKGKLRDNEIAVKVAREFFEALIAKDYDRAGQIAEGMPGEYLKKWIKERVGDISFVRIVEIGLPTPHPNKETCFLVVPVTAEVQKDGKKSIQKFTLSSRAAYNQPDRWTADDFKPAPPPSTQAASGCSHVNRSAVHIAPSFRAGDLNPDGTP